MILSILIPTLPEPFNKSRLRHLLITLNRQCRNHDVEILTDDRDRTIPTGTKRNDLITRATGRWVSFVDDDDRILPGYVSSIMQAITEDPDVVTFCGKITTNGKNEKHWVIKLGETYEERNNVYYRYPNHLAVMKKELVQHIKFPDIWIQEDYQYATAIRDAGVLKTEVHIPHEIYHYDFETPQFKAQRRR